MTQVFYPGQRGVDYLAKLNELHAVASAQIGPMGPQGPAGMPLVILGILGSQSILPLPAAPGDAYMVAGELWTCNGTSWSNLGRIQGPEGPRGFQGVQGEQGIQGLKGDKGEVGDVNPLMITYANSAESAAISALESEVAANNSKLSAAGSADIALESLDQTAANLAAATQKAADSAASAAASASSASTAAAQATEAATQAGHSATSAAAAQASANAAHGSEVNAAISASNAADASRLTVGTVTTLVPGSSASTTISGPAGQQVLNISIPRGDKGETGDTGATGNSIASIVRTTGNGAVGTTDTYTITFTSGATTTFTVSHGSGSGDMTKAVYDADDDGVVDHAASTPWSGVTGKPSVFTPDTHSHGDATTGASGFMSATDKAKLDGVASGATNYTHPANHSPSIITQDANNRFVTDAEKAAWSAKGDVTLAGAQTLTNKKISAYHYIDKTVINPTATGVVQLDLSAASVFELTLTGNVSLSIQNAPALSGETISFIVRISQGATAYSVTMFNTIVWLTINGAAPAAPAANKTIEYVFTSTTSGTYFGRKGAAT